MLLEGDRSIPTDESVSLAIIEAVAAREDVDPVDLNPPEYEALFDVCDPEALDALFRDRPTGDAAADIAVSLVFCGYELTVTGPDDVTVSESR
ncbi:HalOD1 output domain-containing protein [Halovivax limisalsi]|uniref:HalOD1 output domain-containing protein n=1 Tax=Halovivax limisalsi TaxID=1453760 RepID=UPI001FFC5133|nr:HalOD1 output domain-containing protein [Halovivax limisalsi]